MMAGRGGVTVPVVTTVDTRSLQMLQKKLREVKSEVGGFSKVGERLNKIVTGAGILSAAGAFGHLAQEGSKAYKEQRLTEGIIQRMGLAASVTTTQVEELSTAISNNTGQSRENVNAAANTFLSFRNLVKPGADAQKTLEGLTQTAVDLAARMKTDAPSAAMVLARALNRPERAGLALAKAQVPLTDATNRQVKALVKEGKLQAARALIIQDVTKSVQGLAAQTASPFEKFQAQLQNVQVSIGEALLPAFQQLLPAVLPLIQAVGILAANFATSLLPILQPIVDLFAPLAQFVHDNADAMQQLVTWVVIGTGAFKTAGIVTAAYKGIMQAYAFSTYATAAGEEGLTFAQWARTAATKAATGATAQLTAAMEANPIGVILLAVTLLVGGFIMLFKHSKHFRNFIVVAFKEVGKVVGAVVGGILHGVAFLIRAFKEYLDFYIRMAGHILDASVVAFGWIPGLGDSIKGAKSSFVDLAKTVDAAIGGAADTVDNFAHQMNVGIQNGMNGVAAKVDDYGKTQKKVAKKQGKETGKAWYDGFNTNVTGAGKAGSKTKGIKTKAVSPVKTAGDQSFTVAGTGGGLSLSVTVNGSVVQERDIARTIRNEIIQLTRRQGMTPNFGV